jgi:regulator of protease activity HflC (stomatin/prohibitin superfamily)
MASFDITSLYLPLVLIVILTIYLLSGIRIIRPINRMVVETFGKFTRVQKSGITIVIPFVQKPVIVNITDRLVDVQRQEVITKDNLNCIIDAQIYYRVGETNEEVRNAIYVTNDYQRQIIQLAKTTLRNVIGDNMFRDVNSNRAKLNLEIFQTMSIETKNWGIRMIRVELKEIEPPKDVQETMNQVIKAENDKQSAVDFANAVETKADGEKRAQIKTAEGIKQSKILEAEGEAQAIERKAKARATEIELVNEAAERYFVGNAKDLKELEVTQASLEKNSKIVLTEKGITPTLVLNETKDNVIPTAKIINDEETQ